MLTHLNFTVCTALLLLTYAIVKIGGDGSYKDVKALHDSILSSTTYSPIMRPLKNQTGVMTVRISFSLVAIVAVDDVRQELITNGFLFIFWDDEVHSWNTSDYDGFSQIVPNAKQIWRPRLSIINTMEDRDPFEDDYSYTLFTNNGDVGWVPGALFHTYCALKMEKFPFDVQTCTIQMVHIKKKEPTISLKESVAERKRGMTYFKYITGDRMGWYHLDTDKLNMLPIGHTVTSLQFEANSVVNLGFYFPNPGWDLLESKTTVENVSVVPTQIFSCPTFSFTIKRRPANIVLNVILPVVFMSVLNNLVFFIPGESGEKISYAITVLLSLSVFLSMVSTMTPQVTDTIPAITIYLFVLLLSSVFTVAAAIFIVFLQHKEEEEEMCMEGRPNSKSSNRFINIRTAVTPFDNTDESTSKTDLTTKDDTDYTSRKPGYNKHRLISKHIDKFFFVLLTCIWLIMTIWFFGFATS